MDARTAAGLKTMTSSAGSSLFTHQHFLCRSRMFTFLPECISRHYSINLNKLMRKTHKSSCVVVCCVAVCVFVGRGGFGSHWMDYLA